ncbi:MAG: BlaI/MecI/CopY family transcriptional regulator [Oscillospiraceae bacterium]|nr:BlaI/MecI/CopY family transcriptional regulator [Oscillospiraceae bacterium]
MKMKKLPESELEIMIALWEADGPVPRNYFDKKLKESKNWADSTILSLLGRLQEKGFLSCQKQGNRNLYEPLVSEKEYLAYENRHFLKKLHGNSICNLVASMVKSEDLTQSDLEDLRHYLDQVKKEGEK